MKSLLYLILWVGSIALVSPLKAAPGSYPAKPKALVEAYLRADSEAAGLSPSTWPELGRYTTFPKAPQWESFVVIDHYEITRVMEGHTRAQVRVTYYPLGQMSDAFKPDTRPENVIFFLSKTKGEWKVDGAPLMPHVSFEIMKKRLETNSAANPKERAANEKLIQEIQASRSGSK